MSALQNLPSNINYLSPVGFRFTLANFPDVNYFCQAANIPGLSIGMTAPSSGLYLFDVRYPDYDFPLPRLPSLLWGASREFSIRNEK